MIALNGPVERRSGGFWLRGEHLGHVRAEKCGDYVHIFPRPSEMAWNLTAFAA